MPHVPGAVLITVLAAQPVDRQAVLHGLQQRLHAQGSLSLHLPCMPAPQPWQPDWLQTRAQELDAALAQPGIVLHESSAVHAAAQWPTALPLPLPAELHAAAQSELARSALVLLCAPSSAHDDASSTQATGDRLRSSLLAARASFSVIRDPVSAAAGVQAWQALCLLQGWPVDEEVQQEHTRPARATRPSMGRGACDKCSDPGCEHRLFSSLLAERTAV